MKKLAGFLAFVLILGGSAAASDLVEINEGWDGSVDVTANESFNESFTVTWNGEEEGLAIVETNITDSEGKDASEAFDISYYIEGEAGNTTVLKAGEQMQARMEVDVDFWIKGGDYNFNTTAEVRTDKYGVQVQAPQSTEERGSDTYTYNFSVKNRGAAEDTYNITAQEAEGWDINVQDNLTLGGWAEENVSVDITIPSNEENQTTNELNLTAQSQSNDTIFDLDSMNITYFEEVSGSGGTTGSLMSSSSEIKVTWLTAEVLDEKAPADTRITYTIENQGNAEGDKGIEVQVEGKVIDSQTHSLGPDEEKTVELTHTIQKPGTYLITAGQAETTVFIPTEGGNPDINVTELKTDIIGEGLPLPVDISYTVKNFGGSLGEKEIDLLVDDEVYITNSHKLEPGQEENKTSLYVFYEEGSHKIKVGNQETEIDVASEAETQAPGLTGRIIENSGMFILGLISVIILLGYGIYRWKENQVERAGWRH